ncbi:hypothetical protein HPC49_08800 [Pyxidicoccus fallax]|uniref:Uncharacterized protein n=1 Tax=Pyxidicoccus fallax TaxID=394095 RepID=A0A848L5H5_9BACT|nr:hypothetical protein [Pyxidicoccus fallax]NMO13944.1 hypothetical protein [Pyxidicoccus fallax]NPC78343.1 hypothetical protein [Pyxidicoccus fallax]
MRKPTPKSVPSPRAEATPFLYSNLTSDQQRAGSEIAATLRDMADEPWSAPHGGPQEHAYLPHLDRARTNRVLLIDGGRGTGKSTLLLTLLNAYRRSVLGAKEPRWIRGMAEMIIPVEIIDLQPLPPSTNLALHVMGRLKSVVDTVEPPPTTSTSSKPIWDEASGPRLRDKWNRLMRLLATWDESLEARVGRQDTSSYVIEIIEEELERGQLAEGFRDAVDALVEGYASKFGRGGNKKPLFLVPIDDADMNPKLSARLLELLRKLWHPRLSFLMAGDSRLFLLRLQESLLAQGSRASKDGAPYLRLAQDTYEKDIPNSARFLLGALKPGERVERNQEIHSLLQRYSVEVQRPEIPREDERTPPTLRDYFLANLQSSELLPDRLRQISELTARLRRASPTEEEMTPRATLPIVQWLWQETSEALGEEDERWKRLKGAVQSAQLDGQLRLDTRLIQMRPELRPVVRFRVEQSAYTLTLQTLNRFSAVLKPNHVPGEFVLRPSDGDELPERLTACWVLASDIAADGVHEGPLDESESSVDEGSVRFVLASRPASSLEPALEVPWPLPAWQAPVDYVIFSRHWTEQLAKGRSSPGRDAGRLARHFLWLVIQICQHRAVKEPVEWDHPPSWTALAEQLGELARPQVHGSPRQQRCASWASTDAPLIAAPESGLPEEDASDFLSALIPTLGASWSVKELRARRLARLSSIPGRTRLNFDPEQALVQLDGAAPAHPFVQALKGLHLPSNRQGVRQGLLEYLGYRTPPPHSGIFREKEFRLERYRTALRQEALGDLPEPLYSNLREKIEGRPNRALAPVVLVNVWRLLAKEAGHPDVVSWFWLEKTRIQMSNTAAERGRILREVILNSRAGATTSIPIDSTRGLIIERFAPVAPASDLPAPLDAVFRLIFDYVQDQDDDSAPADTKLTVWPLVSTQLTGRKPHLLRPWPDVLWPSLMEYEEAPKAWAERVNSLDEWLALETLDYMPYAVDAFALNFLENRAGFYRRSQGGSIDKGEVTTDDYRAFLKGIWPVKPPTSGRRHTLLEHWVRRLPLMATPEAGLSDDVARVFLEPAQLQDLTPPQLHELRRERTLASGVLPAEVDATLADIDETFPHHPWVEHMKQSSGK